MGCNSTRPDWCCRRCHVDGMSCKNGSSKASGKPSIHPSTFKPSNLQTYNLTSLTSYKTHLRQGQTTTWWSCHTKVPSLPPKLSPQDPQSKGQDQLRGNDAKRSAQSTKALFKLCLVKAGRLRLSVTFDFEWKIFFQSCLRFRLYINIRTSTLVFEYTFTIHDVHGGHTGLQEKRNALEELGHDSSNSSPFKKEAVEELLSQGCVQ